MFSPVIKLPQAIAITKNQETQDNYVLFFDGCCKGNPGPGGAGAVIYNNGIELWADCVFVGKKITNNIAEYTGLIIGLKQSAKLGIKNIAVNGDSQLVIKQMNGIYKVTSENLVELYKTAKQLEKSFDSISYNHVYRKDNKRADELSNQGLLKIQ
ncbi:MAG: reverse transcriptase-like protein [Alphaproteobacteria bacterium]|uniref:RNase H type-1 domain-containing protein n=1 Tax=viral metagenome TaxID=1070528 RepID=A0A6C0HQK6_9ZZZZ|nr:reverse transcriptase-like protein [Alphaproteobacteria bacterium]